MPVSARFKPIDLSPRKRRHRGRPTRAALANKNTQRNGLKAQVSQATRDRLINEALVSPACWGMSLVEVSAYINPKLDALLTTYPWWYGHLAKDQPCKPMTDGQRQALEKARQRKARQRKADIQREVDTPYASTAS